MYRVFGGGDSPSTFNVDLESQTAIVNRMCFRIKDLPSVRLIGVKHRGVRSAWGGGKGTYDRPSCSNPNLKWPASILEA